MLLCYTNHKQIYIHNYEQHSIRLEINHVLDNADAEYC
jgi:hypothetical protein